MSGRLNYVATTLTIPINTAVSNAVELPKNLRAISVFGPAALTNAVKIAVSPDGGVTYNTLQSGGSDVAVAADKCVVVDIVAFTHIVLESAGNEAAARSFPLRFVEDI
jgi:hypothetical protein